MTLWNPMTRLSGRVFSVPNQSGFSSPCLTHTCLTVRAGGQNTLWGTHLFHSLQRHLLQPDILCSVISSSSSSLPQSLLDGLELEPIYNPLQVWSHLYSHLSSTFAKSQSRLHSSWESRPLRKVQLPSILPSSPFMPRIQETPCPVPNTHPPPLPSTTPGSNPLLWSFSGPGQRGRKRTSLCPRQRSLQPLPTEGALLLGQWHDNVQVS